MDIKACRRTGGKWDPKDKTCNWIDAYYDDELSPPSWIARKVKQLPDNSLVVMGSDLAEDKKEAIEIGKNWAKKRKMKFIGVWGT